MIKSKKAPNKRQLQAQTTRKKIFKTALKLFSKYGYQNVTVDDIVKQAGIAKGTFYIHFSAKDQIVLNEFKKTDSLFIQKVKTIDKTADATHQLLAFVEIIMKNATDVLTLETVKILYTNQINAADQSNLLTDEQRPYFQMVKEIIENGQAAGHFRNDVSSIDLTRMFTRWIRAVIYDWCLCNGGFDLNKEGLRYMTTMLPLFQKSSVIHTTGTK